MCAKSPRIPWPSVLRRTMVSQCSCPEIVYSSLMENIFPNSRCLSQSVPDPHYDCKWKGQLVQVQEHLFGPLGFLLDGGAFCGRMNKRNVAIKLCILLLKSIYIIPFRLCNILQEGNLLSEVNGRKSFSLYIQYDWQPFINMSCSCFTTRKVHDIVNLCVLYWTYSMKACRKIVLWFWMRQHSIGLWNIYILQW